MQIPVPKCIQTNQLHIRCHSVTFIKYTFTNSAHWSQSCTVMNTKVCLRCLSTDESNSSGLCEVLLSSCNCKREAKIRHEKASEVTVYFLKKNSVKVVWLLLEKHQRSDSFTIQSISYIRDTKIAKDFPKMRELYFSLFKMWNRAFQIVYGLCESIEKGLLVGRLVVSRSQKNEITSRHAICFYLYRSHKTEWEEIFNSRNSGDAKMLLRKHV